MPAFDALRLHHLAWVRVPIVTLVSAAALHAVGRSIDAGDIASMLLIVAWVDRDTRRRLGR